MTNTILLALTPIFFVLALGYGAGRLGLVDDKNVDSLNAVVMTFSLPAALLEATAAAPRSELLARIPLFVISGVVMLCVFMAWYLLQDRSSAASKSDASLQALTIAFPNLAGVGLPVLSDVVGPAGAVPIAIVLVSGSLIVSPLALVIVELSLRKNSGATTPTSQVLRALWHAVTKPVVVAPAFGILLSLCELKLGRILDSCLLLVGQAAASVALFLTGLILSSEPFRLDWRIVRATGMANIIRPLLTAAVVVALPISPDTVKVAILLAAVPSGFFGILFAVNYRLDYATAGSMVLASTVLSIFTLAIAIAVLYPAGH